jgi:hypothetical protein
MKKLLISLALPLLAATPTWADELHDALHLHAQHQYAQALPLLTKLAEAGNAQAQAQLGDMYWYGDGMPVDLKQAEYWFTKAAQSGDAKAQGSLAVMRARVARKDDIAYYTTRFDGGELQFSKARCVRPVVPAVSKSNEDIRRVSADVRQWVDCYNGYARKLSAAQPPLKLVPKDILDIMSDDDVAHAQALMDKTLAAQADDARKLALQVNTETEAWHAATEAYVKEANNGKGGMSLAEWDDMQRAHANQAGSYNDVYNARQAGAQRPGGSGK